MNTIRTKLLLGSLLCAATLLGQEPISGVTAATTVKNAITNGVAMFSFSVTDTSGSANRIYIRDNSGTTTNKVIPSYTYIVQYPTNLVVSYTNAAGVVGTYTNSVQYVATATQAATTNAARLINMIQIPASGTVSWYPDSVQGATYGIQLYSLGATTYNITYLPLP